MVPPDDLPQPDHPPMAETLWDDGRVTVDRFPQVIEMGIELLGLSEAISARVHFTFSNGVATYRVLGARGTNLVCELTNSWMMVMKDDPAG